MVGFSGGNSTYTLTIPGHIMALSGLLPAPAVPVGFDPCGVRSPDRAPLDSLEKDGKNPHGQA